MSELITPEQEAALEQAMKVLKEHFDAAVICVRATDENEKSNYPAQWHGHLSDIRGVLAITSARIDASFVKNLIEED